jgi:hypothetical protein
LPPTTTPTTTTTPAKPPVPGTKGWLDWLKSVGKLGLNALTLPSDLAATFGGNLATRVGGGLFGNVVGGYFNPLSAVGAIRHPTVHNPPNNSIIRLMGIDTFGMTEEQKVKIITWMFDKWDKMGSKQTYRTVREMAQYIINEPDNYLNRWNKFVKVKS